MPHLYSGAFFLFDFFRETVTLKEQFLKKEDDYERYINVVPK